MRTNHLVGAALGAVLLVALVFEAVTLSGAYRDLRSGTDASRAAARELGSDPARWTPDTVKQADADADRGRRLVDRGSGRLHADPILEGLAALPWLGDNFRAVLDLGAAAQSAAAATRDAVTVARLYSEASGAAGSPGRFVAVLRQAQGPLGDASRRLHGALDTLNRDRGGALLPPISHALDTTVVQLATATDQADAFARASRLVPPAVGDPTPKTYLVILANPTELRPDGGFAGVVGTMTFDHGAPTTVHLVDQYSLNGHYKQAFPIPAPIRQHLVEADNRLEIGDAGWDPDLPTTAPLLENMWLSATGQAVDGTIVLDGYAIQALLRITGPITVNGYGQFTSDNLLTSLNILINAAGGDKGTAVPAIAAQLLRSILGQPGTSYPKMASVLVEQGHQRHLQVYSQDRTVEAALAETGLDGSVRSYGLSDYLMVVDGNLSATKGDAYVTKQAEIRVEKPRSGIANHEVKLTYTFPVLTTETDKKLGTAFSTGNRNGDYRDYVRVYVPQEANLSGFQILIDGKPAATSSIAENTVVHGKRALGAYFELAPGHTATVSITYTAPLPPGRDYNLIVQKQAGRPSLPTSLWLSYPGGQAKRSDRLEQDARFEVRW